MSNGPGTGGQGGARRQSMTGRSMPSCDGGGSHSGQRAPFLVEGGGVPRAVRSVAGPSGGALATLVWVVGAAAPEP